MLYSLGAVHKRRPQSGRERDLSSANILRQREVSSAADVRTFWCKKLRICEIKMCPRGSILSCIPRNPHGHERVSKEEALSFLLLLIAGFSHNKVQLLYIQVDIHAHSFFFFQKPLMVTTIARAAAQD